MRWLGIGGASGAHLLDFFIGALLQGILMLLKSCTFQRIVTHPGKQLKNKRESTTNDHHTPNNDASHNQQPHKGGNCVRNCLCGRSQRRGGQGSLERF